MSPKVRNAKRSRRGEQNLSWFNQGIHVERRKEEENGRTFELRKCSFWSYW
jgi:hypothetical protein